jgi:hypothetical protein
VVIFEQFLSNIIKKSHPAMADKSVTESMFVGKRFVMHDEDPYWDQLGATRLDHEKARWKEFLFTSEPHQTCIMVSELATLAGLNTYERDREENLCRHMGKFEHNFVLDIKSAIAKLDAGNEDKPPLTRFEKQADIESTILRNVDFGSEFSTEQFNEIARKLDPRNEHKVKFEVLQGVALEASAITELKKREGFANIKTGIAPVFGSCKLPSGQIIRIFGRVDAVLTSAQGVPIAIIEVKNRKNRFKVHNHEPYQLAAYTILSGVKKGYLVEHLDGELRVHEYGFRELLELWNSVLTNATFGQQVSSVIKLMYAPLIEKMKFAALWLGIDGSNRWIAWHKSSSEIHTK